MRLPIAVIATGIFAAPAMSANYMAKPLQPASQRIITRDVVWACGPDACQAATDESRPAVLCQGLAKRTGRLQSFLANGRSFTTAELKRCNQSARR